VSSVGFLLNLSFPAEARHVEALRDVIVQAVRQSGGDEDRGREFAERAAALLHECANGQPQPDTMSCVVELGPPIQVRVGDRTVTLATPAEAGHRDAGHHDAP
jgi:hypothetical protein